MASGVLVNNGIFDNVYQLLIFLVKIINILNSFSKEVIINVAQAHTSHIR